jgi:rsbT co-antagonist protein RsbR
MTDSSSMIATLQAENERLRQQVSTLEAYRIFTEHAWEGMIRTDQSYLTQETNRSFDLAFGAQAETVQAELIEQIKTSTEIQARLLAEGRWEGKLAYRYEGILYQISSRCMRLQDLQGQTSGYLLSLLDIRTLYNHSIEIRALKTVIERSPNAVIFWRGDGTITYANPSTHTMLGYEPGWLIGKHISTYVDVSREKEARLVKILSEEGSVRELDVFRHKDGHQLEVDAIAFNLPTVGDEEMWLGAIAIDIGDYLSLKAERDQMHEQIINAQNDLLREISTPLIPLAEGVLAMPIVGAVNNQRAQQIMESLLEGISQHQAEIAILDITGVKMIDTQIADSLVRVAQAARLLGTQVILSGISGEVAQTLVHLEADFSEITTMRNLQEAIQFALNGALVA